MKTWVIALIGVALAAVWILLARIAISWVDGVFQRDVFLWLALVLIVVFLVRQARRADPQTTTYYWRMPLFAIGLVATTTAVVASLYIALNNFRDTWSGSASAAYSMLFDGLFFGALLILGATLLLCLASAMMDYRSQK